MRQTIILDPFIPLSLLSVLAVVSVGLGLFYWWRSGASGLFRLGALLSILGLLANPQLQSDERTPLNDIVLVIKDTTASQRLDDRALITQTIEERLGQSITQSGAVEIRTVTIEGDEETRLLDNMQSALADIPRDQLAGIFIISDGQITDIDRYEDTTNALPAIRQMVPENLPVHAILTGHPDEIDRRIILQTAPRYGIVRESVRVSFRIEDLGPNDSTPRPSTNVPVRLRLDGEQIIEQSVPTGRDVGFDVPLERPGNVIVELIVDELDGELSTRNNIAVLPITSVRDRLRVLLISGEPNPGERVWRNLLKSDPSIDMVHFTILRTADKFDAALPNELALIPFPTDPLFIEKLREFDLVIFDRYTWRNVLKSYHFDNIARFVEEGGAMLVASGPEYNGVLSLARRRTISYLLPALPMAGTIQQAFRPTVTPAGKRHPVTANLPDQEFWGRWLRAIPTQLRKGQTLISGPQDAPILILDRVGKGRIGMIQSDHIWLWARGFDGGGPHAELLRRTAHWLMKEPQLEEESLRLEAQGDILTVLRQTMSDQPGTVTLTQPDGTSREIALNPVSEGLFAATLPDMPTGLYRGSSEDLFAIGAVGLAAAPEYQNIVSDSRKLGPIAAATGGGLFTPRETNNTLRLPAIRPISNSAQQLSGPGWAGIIKNRASQLEGRTNKPLTTPWVWLMILVFFIAIAWGLESRSEKA